MMIGPAPMMRIEEMSVRFGILSPSGPRPSGRPGSFGRLAVRARRVGWIVGAAVARRFPAMEGAGGTAARLASPRKRGYGFHTSSLKGAKSPLPARGERVRPAAERAERSEAGVRGRRRKRRPSATQRLLRRRPLTLACFAGLLPPAALSPQAGRGESRFSPRRSPQAAKAAISRPAVPHSARTEPASRRPRGARAG